VAYLKFWREARGGLVYGSIPLISPPPRLVSFSVSLEIKYFMIGGMKANAIPPGIINQPSAFPVA
jgi:hypothetical protein